ncbi:MAG: CPBP family intramembrane metalloprotease [Nitrososphaerales archaeon]|nr:CPBP family intramembrane metalloprotease [Nitrososphaerales archaeon]
MVTTIILQYLQERSGIPTGTIPERDPIMMFVSISIAPLVEEIGFRLSFIGLIAAYLAFMADGRLRSILYALWHPKGCLDKLIVKKNKTSKEVGILNVMVILSGIIFGLAHITYGAGWEVGKLSQATLAGIALGWLYINYGFHAAVLLHWAFNYFTSAYYYLNKVLKILYVTDLANISVIITGFLGYLIIVFMIFKRLRR